MERRQRERRAVGRRQTDRVSVPADRTTPEQSARRRRWIAIGIVIGGFLVAVPDWSGIGWALGRQTTVAPELVGVWTTNAPGYGDRALEFTRYSVLLHTDEYHFTVHLVRRVSHERHALYTTFHIEYQDVDAVTPLVFRFIPSPRPLIRLEHFAGVWRRVPPR